jgi:formylglycine-generating enzyme required for sulfatase activity
MIPTLSKSGCAAAVFYLSAFSGVAMAQPASIQISPAGNVTVTWNASASGPVNVERSANLSAWEVVSPGNTGGNFTEPAAGAARRFYRLSKMVAVAGNATVAGFLISNTETTWGEWNQVRSWAVANGYSDLATGAAEGNAALQPVHSVSWHDAVKWCNAWSEMEGRTPAYTVNGTVYKTGAAVPVANTAASGYRLPTGAEWVWAARGGTFSQNSTYSGGNNVDAVAWYDGNSGGSPQPVGGKTPNELAVFDMSGNLLEWCWDSVGSNRLLKGGFWMGGASGCEITVNFNQAPAYRSAEAGFRTVRRL